MTQHPITPSLIKELRDRTGIGMGKCKEALEKTNGDIELAITNLRKEGMATAVKKEGRLTNEGELRAITIDNTLYIIEVNAETDFVVKNARFQEFLQNLTDEIKETQPENLEAFLKQSYSKDPTLTVDAYRATIVQAIGENIQISRFEKLPLNSDHSCAIYTHFGGKVITFVEISGSQDETSLAKDLAMQVAAAEPQFLSPETVPPEVLESERDIAKNQAVSAKENASEDIINRIVDSKIKTFYENACLLNQKFIKDNKLTVLDLVNQRSKEIGKPLSVTGFQRWKLGR